MSFSTSQFINRFQSGPFIDRQCTPISPKQLDCRNKSHGAGTAMEAWISHAGGGAVWG